MKNRIYVCLSNDEKITDLAMEGDRKKFQNFLITTLFSIFLAHKTGEQTLISTEKS